VQAGGIFILDSLRRLAIVISLLAFATAPGLAQQVGATDAQLFDQYTLQAHAEQEVANDLLSVELLVQAQDKDSSSLANRINADMQWALAILKEHQSIKSRTRNYRTWPRYERNGGRVVGWNASQTLSLESEDFDATPKVIQKLQEKLQVSNMRMQPKEETRTKMEDELINAALNRFKQRAEIVQLNMGAADYRVMEISINTERGAGGYPQADYEYSRATSKLSSAPSIEGGTSQVRVQVFGKIQLQ